jgi:FtsP/CotA-like multicopper oxidase with cupredoxin domain
MNIYAIVGLVREHGSSKPIAGAQVRAFDRDEYVDDLMGESITGADGRFEIGAGSDAFGDFIEDSPDVVIDVRLAKGAAYSVRCDLRWRAGRLLPLDVDVPGDVLEARDGSGNGTVEKSANAESKKDKGKNPPAHAHGEGASDDHGHSHGDSDDHGHDSGAGDDHAPVSCGWCGHSHGRHERCHVPKPPDRCRDIYLKIEKIAAYSPVAPDDAEHHKHRRDCMRNPTHEDTHIPHAEVEQRKFDAVVYREYLDPAFTIPNTAPMVPADINEPRYDRRVPGAVLYAEPGERLFIHVLNADDFPHSFHVHGLVYGIDSDGSWPFGVADPDGRRSDAICPGDEWCYTFDVTEETIGAWPFHDHYAHVSDNVNLGLFGGLIVRDRRCPEPDLEVPFFLHRLSGSTSGHGAGHADTGFDSGTLAPGGTFVHPFPNEGTFEYFCRFHPMQGIVRVTTGGPASASVSIKDGPPRFDAADVTVRPGGLVTWTHQGAEPHTVTQAAAAAKESMCINGRSFIGNTPTIRAKAGRRIRWYVFNLDLGTLWHNFHVHGQRFRVGNETVDTRSLSPADSFIADTVVPPVVLLPLKNDCADHASHCCGKEGEVHLRDVPGLLPRNAGHGRSGGAATGGGHHGGAAVAHDPHASDSHSHEHGSDSHSPDHGSDSHDHDHGSGHEHGSSLEPGKKVRLRGDFLVHCHIEMHMMEGMVALVRSIQTIKVTKELADAYCFELPLDHPDECPIVDLHPCGGGAGTWERLPDSPIFIVHAALMRTGRVLVWSGTAEVGDPLESRVWNPVTGTMTTQLFGEDLFCAGQTFLSDGRLLIGGGAPAGSLDSTHIFDPATENWTKVNDMLRARWYPTLVPLADGRVMAFSGSGVSDVEVYSPATGTWTLVTGATRNFPELYPSLHVVPNGQIFYSRTGWAMAATGNTNTAYLSLTGPTSGTWSDLGALQFNDRQEGTAVISVDTSATPPAARVTIIGGGVSAAATLRNPQTAETIDLTTFAPAPAWTRTADMHYPRVNVNAVLLPDGTIFVVGGQRAGKWNADPQAVLEPEIYDPRSDTWTVMAPMEHPRQYHSIAVLLPDGRVLTAGGVDPRPGVVERDQRSMEVFSPPYLAMGPRPVITTAPGAVAYGATFDIVTPDPGGVDAVVLMRPGAVTHHTDAGQRYVKLAITGRTAAHVSVRAPANGDLAPPGFYMLFIVKANGVPSVAAWQQLG